MVVRQQCCDRSLIPHGRHESRADVASDQPVAVLGERRNRHRSIQRQPNQLAEWQIVVELVHHRLCLSGYSRSDTVDETYLEISFALFK
jgi:hypothetical protein